MANEAEDKHVVSAFSGNDVSELIKCINFAAVKHKNQRRNDEEQTPYINHPIGRTVIPYS